MDEILLTSPGLTTLIITNTSLYFFLNNKYCGVYFVLKKKYNPKANSRNLPTAKLCSDLLK